MNSALLIIDFQNTIFTDPPAFDAKPVLRRIGVLIEKARNAGTPVIFVQHEEPDSAWRARSESWEFPRAIAPRSGDFVFAKTSCDAFRNTGLQAHLAAHGIRRVFICGYATDFCIDTNVRRAASLELETVVVSDAHTTRDRPHLAAQQIIEHHNWIWREFSNPGNPIKLCAAEAVRFATD